MFNEENYIKLTEFVRGIPEEHFDMSDILINVDENLSDRQVKKALLNTCGTTGCVFGFLPFVFPDSFKYICAQVVCKNEPEKDFYDVTARQEVCNLLGIHWDELSYLFMRVRNDNDEPFDMIPAALRTKEQQISFMEKFYTYKTGEKYPYV